MMRSPGSGWRCAAAAATFLLAVGVSLARQTVVPASPAPALSRSQQIAFLQKARIIAAQPIGKGVTRPHRLTLSDGTFTHDAAFQSIEERFTDQDLREGRRRVGEVRFTDSWQYNVAAYRLAELLGIESMMPATVERTWSGRRGALSWWVDDVLMDEEERESSGATPPDIRPWYEQRQRMVVFAALIYDTDRNKGNVLYTTDWGIVMIDFTRAFRLERTLKRPDMIDRIDRRLFERIEALSPGDVQRAASRYLTIAEVSALFARRDHLVRHVRELVAARGASVVFY